MENDNKKALMCLSKSIKMQNKGNKNWHNCVLFISFAG